SEMAAYFPDSRVPPGEAIRHYHEEFERVMRQGGEEANHAKVLLDRDEVEGRLGCGRGDRVLRDEVVAVVPVVAVVLEQAQLSLPFEGELVAERLGLT